MCIRDSVYTYLKSKVGSLILQTNGYGSVITHVEPDHLSDIPVPDAPVELRQRIHNLIARSYASVSYTHLRSMCWNIQV